MVRKKRQSKRISTKKRVKIAKNVTAHKRKERRNAKKTNKDRIRAPPSIFFTEEEKKSLAEIKRNTLIRQEIYEKEFNKETNTLNDFVRVPEKFDEVIKNNKL